MSAAYELAWDDSPLYVKKPASFRGFFAGEGNRTYIPNQFFDQVIPHERLTTIQVVGATIRFSIGFVNKFGHRRQRVALSYRDIQRYARIGSPRALTRALREAMAKNYIERVEEGYFDPRGGALSRAAHYALRWARQGGAVSPAPKREAGRTHAEMGSGTTPKGEAAPHSERGSDIQITSTNNILKQQPVVAGPFSWLKEQGFDDRAAQAIANRYPAERIERQIRWLGKRTIKLNRLGMLRAAIEQDWPPGNRGRPGSIAASGTPDSVGPKTTSRGGELRQRNSARPAGASFADAVRQAEKYLIQPSNPPIS